MTWCENFETFQIFCSSIEDSAGGCVQSWWYTYKYSHCTFHVIRVAGMPLSHMAWLPVWKVTLCLNLPSGTSKTNCFTGSKNVPDLCTNENLRKCLCPLCLSIYLPVFECFFLYKRSNDIWWTETKLQNWNVAKNFATLSATAISAECKFIAGNNSSSNITRVWEGLKKLMIDGECVSIRFLFFFFNFFFVSLYLFPYPSSYMLKNGGPFLGLFFSLFLPFQYSRQ